MEKILVTGHHLYHEEPARPQILLYGDNLHQQLSDNIGSTISSQPGVHNSSFGPAIGRPLIHGLGGPRVRIMEEHIDTMDISSSSSDHSVSIDPFIIDEIEILKGPNTLLYGSGAIGGVVNIYAGRVPQHVPKRPLVGKIALSMADNGEALNGAVRLDGGIGQSMAWHVDISHRRSEDIKIPGLAQSKAFRTIEQVGRPTESFVEGLLPFSDQETQNGSLGFSFINEESFIGFAINQINMNYGLPGFKHEDVGGEEERRPFIDLKQNRIYLKSGLLDPLEGVESINFNFGVSDYRHDEFESSGEKGTRFKNDAWEGRIELVHYPFYKWHGVIGTHISHRNHSAIGEEALTPPIETNSLGLFWFGHREFGESQLETGLRFDHIKHSPEGQGDKEFRNFSTSLGGVTPINNNLKLNLVVDYANRAPVGEELFSNGPHLASRGFEIGDPDLKKEVAVNISTGLNYEGESHSGFVSIYATEFSNFIHQKELGDIKEGLPIRQFVQNKASYFGVEGKVSSLISSWKNGYLKLDTFFDTVSAQIDTLGNKNLPRTPPSRMGVGFKVKSHLFTGSLNYLYAFKQDKVAENELATDSYGDLSLYMGWKLNYSSYKANLFFRARNLGDTEQRHHPSRVKDIAPAPGRTIIGGVNITF